ncbi:EamA family transporter [Ginsengibacter hankyongi]|uniref:EamA family transporter n=1 Tax=Ginsengibacter hankyongi TaxID=2607284 RepID=A0A5J5IGC0_9BACT|nr:EamA family transporter [Ginsengibacter hankyongi]KAA9038120.1 EamA family transporter [Ginsengibacter hankyongi]
MKSNPTHRFSFIVAGFFFALLWSSASAATKIGLQSAQPFVIAVTRFFIAGAIMLFIAHVILGKRLPQKQEWKQLVIYGLLNISIYLGLYVTAMQNVSAGLGSLSVGTSPVLISIMAAIWFRQPIKMVTIISLLLCTAGIIIAAYPLIKDSYATPMGITILLISMISYSAGAIYFSKNKWSDLHILTINGWQTLAGGIILLPVLLVTYHRDKNIFDFKWIASVLWLAIPVSIAAVQLWLYLLKDNPVKASFWLFVCPISGFIIASILLKEPLSLYTFFGVAFVIAGLYLVFKRRAL